MSEWDEWDQTDEYTSVSILSMSCGQAQPETESPDLSEDDVREVASSDEASEVDVHQNQSRVGFQPCSARAIEIGLGGDRLCRANIHHVCCFR